MIEVDKAAVSNPTYKVISFPSAKLPVEYKALVFSKWLRSLRYGNAIMEKVNQDEYFTNYHKFIENLLSKPDSIVRLAVLSDDHDVVLGFATSREDVLDYIHVHKDQRTQGIAKALMPDGITTFSHITKSAMEIWQKNDKYKHLEFNPFA